MLGDPKTAKGAFHWAALGAVGAIIALLASALFPSLIPLSAKSVRL